ncbi:hypothetical protein [Halobacteriovorax sp. DA5]|uniref:hypothetical protein n=1 Tax=Halobacteriovorax sp. DA5 TaxID=2067553 RepID=UPI0011AEDDD7|nr:hypothetical protein [Halobacteriovorax sp. DA5]
MLVKKELIRKLVDEFYQVANYLIQDQLQAMQLIIDVATGHVQQGNQVLYKIDNEYFEHQFLIKLIGLAKQRSEQILNKKNREIDSVEKRACVYLFEFKGESVESIAQTLKISQQEVLSYIDQLSHNRIHLNESFDGRTIN